MHVHYMHASKDIAAYKPGKVASFCITNKLFIYLDWYKQAVHAATKIESMVEY